MINNWTTYRNTKQACELYPVDYHPLSVAKRMAAALVKRYPFYETSLEKSAASSRYQVLYRKKA